MLQNIMDQLSLGTESHMSVSKLLLQSSFVIKPGFLDAGEVIGCTDLRLKRELYQWLNLQRINFAHGESPPPPAQDLTYDCSLED